MTSRVQTVDVITAVAPDRMQYLAAAAASLWAQELPRGVHLRWLVCIDGPGGDVPSEVENRATVVRLPRSYGPATARNMAATAGTGEIIRNLDADDVLLPSALADDVTAVNSGAAWSTSEALDMHPDGTLVSFAQGTEDTAIPIGHIRKMWNRQSLLDIHVTTLAVRREVFWKHGGYSALPYSEDVSFLLRINDEHRGLHRIRPSVKYRKWDGQITTRPHPHYVQPIRAAVAWPEPVENARNAV